MEEILKVQKKNQRKRKNQKKEKKRKNKSKERIQPHQLHHKAKKILFKMIINHQLNQLNQLLVLKKIKWFERYQDLCQVKLFSFSFFFPAYFN